jgi:hypothetical protein
MQFITSCTGHRPLPPPPQSKKTHVLEKRPSTV